METQGLPGTQFDVSSGMLPYSQSSYPGAPYPGPDTYNSNMPQPYTQQGKPSYPGGQDPTRQLPRGGGGGGGGRTHNYQAAPTKVFNRGDIPGLGGGGHEEEPSPFRGHDQAATPPGPPGPNTTFPDSPSFYPGMVFAIPMSQPDPEPPAPPSPQAARPTGRQQPQQSPPSQAFGFVRKPSKQQGGSPGGRPSQPPPPSYPDSGFGPDGGTMVLPPPGMGGMLPPQQSQQQQHLLLAPPLGPGGPYGGGPQTPPGAGGMQPPLDERAAQDARQRAYRQELDEQVRRKRMQREFDKRALMQAEAVEEMQAAAAPSPWDPAARQNRRGGGGEPLRDTGGHAVADLRSYNHNHVNSPPQQGPPQPGTWSPLSPPSGGNRPPPYFSQPQGNPYIPWGQGPQGGPPQGNMPTGGSMQQPTQGPLQPRLTVEVPASPLTRLPPPQQAQQGAGPWGGNLMGGPPQPNTMAGGWVQPGWPQQQPPNQPHPQGMMMGGPPTGPHGGMRQTHSPRGGGTCFSLSRACASVMVLC